MMGITERSRKSLRGQEPDGGWPGWIAVLALWFSNFVWVGLTKGMGIMLPTLKEQLDTQTWIIGWITAGIEAMFGLASPFAAPLSKRYQAAYIFIVCGAIIGLSVIAAAFVDNPLQLAVFYTVVAACALGVTNTVTREVVGRCFTKNYATANGIARTGYSMGYFVYAPLVQWFLDTYGWRGTMLLTGALSLHLVVCGCLMVTAHLPRAKSFDYEKFEQNVQLLPNEYENFLQCFVTYRNYIIENFDVALLINARYWAVALIYCCSIFTFTIWLVYFVSQVESKGFTLLEASTMVSVSGVSSLVANLLQGLITDRGVISSWSLVLIFTAVSSASYFASSFLTSYWLLMTSAILILFCDGILTCQYDVLVKDALGVDLMAGAFGWIGLKYAVLLLTLSFLPGWLYDTTGSYTGGFLLIGCMQGISVVIMLLLKLFGKTRE